MMVSEDKQPKYLCFTAEEDNTTVSLTKYGSIADISLEVSINKGAFTPYTIGDTITLSNNNTLEIRRPIEDGTITTLGATWNTYYQFNFSGKLHIEGEIRSLYDGALSDDIITFTSIYNTNNLFANNQDKVTYCDITWRNFNFDLNQPGYKLAGSWKCLTMARLVNVTLRNNILETMFDGATRLNTIVFKQTTPLQFKGYCFRNCPIVTVDYGDRSLDSVCTIQCDADIYKSSTQYVYVDGINIINGFEVLSNTTLKNYCFYNLKLKYIILNENMTSIGNNALNAVTDYIVSLATVPPTLGTSPFPSNIPIYVPYSADHSVLDAYQTASGWSNYAANIFELDENGEIPE